MRDDLFASLREESIRIMNLALRPSPPPRPVDPGPNPNYVALVEAARGEDVFRELVELHEAKWNGYGTAYHCTGDHEGDDYTAWPCETTAIVAKHLGVDVGGGG